MSVVSTHSVLTGFRKYGEAQLATKFDRIIRYDGNPFRAVDAGHLKRKGSALCVGLSADRAGKRGGGRQRITSLIGIDLVVLVAIGGRGPQYDERVKLLDDLSDLVAKTFDPDELKPSDVNAMSLEIQDLRVLVDPDDVFAARITPVVALIRRL